MLNDEKIKTAYEEGYRRGKNWPREWANHVKPGGPWICGPSYPVMHAQTKAENRAWLEGWEKGIGLVHDGFHPPGFNENCIACKNSL